MNFKDILIAIFSITITTIIALFGRLFKAQRRNSDNQLVTSEALKNVIKQQNQQMKINDQHLAELRDHNIRLTKLEAYRGIHDEFNTR